VSDAAPLILILFGLAVIAVIVAALYSSRPGRPVQSAIDDESEDNGDYGDDEEHGNEDPTPKRRVAVKRTSSMPADQACMDDAAEAGLLNEDAGSAAGSSTGSATKKTDLPSAMPME